jgi:hypothetical protein
VLTETIISQRPRVNGGQASAEQFEFAGSIVHYTAKDHDIPRSSIMESSSTTLTTNTMIRVLFAYFFSVFVFASPNFAFQPRSPDQT